MLRQLGFRPGTGLVLERTVALGLAYVLLRSAFAHLGNPYYFLSTLYSYELTGAEAGLGVALVAPFLQMVLAACLLTRWWLREAYLLALLLFVLFVSAQASTLTRGLSISCGCFGAAEGLAVGPRTLVVAGGAALASLFGWLYSLRRGPAGAPDRSPASPDESWEAGASAGPAAACPQGGMAAGR